MTLLEPARVRAACSQSRFNRSRGSTHREPPCHSSAWSDPAERFEVDWAVVMRKDAHYIRQVLTITAGKEDVAISRISLVDATAIDALAIDSTTPRCAQICGWRER